MTRNPLPPRRLSENVTIEWFDGRKTTRHDFGLSRYHDGRPAELFSYAHYGRGNDVESVCRDASLILSLALQNGADIGTIWNAMTRGSNGEPVTLIGAIVKKLAEG